MKSLIFDCDGTLVESEYWCQHGLTIMFRKYGLELETDDLLQRFKGIKLDSILSAIAQQHQVVFEPNFEQRYRAIVADLLTEHLAPCPGVVETLKQLPQHKSVASNGPGIKTRRSLELCGIEQHFGTHVYSAYDVQAWKPDPKLFLFAASQMHTQAQDCIVIEDSQVGIEAAVAAKMSAIYYDPHDLGCSFNDVIVITDMRQLPMAISQLT